jgi:two-component system response regulator HydG
MTILLIDDDQDFLFLLSKRMSKQGYEVYTASNGVSALDELDLHRIDVVISDVVMRDTPIMSLTCLIKAKYPHTPLILISGLPHEPMINNSLNLGADEFIPKPINMPSLLKAVERLGGHA